MSICTCQQTFSASAATLFSRIKTQIETGDGTITGDATGGAFTIAAKIGTVAGSYQISGQQITIQITKKPVFLPCTAICQYIAEQT